VSAGPSLYRRHRPRTFAEVVGQEHVVRTLTHAVERDRVHHAYLFVGSRGTGKTSMAKILAACLNCVKGPTVEPCGVCDSCVSIASASSLDVIEMDAASSNSVDDIRALRESVAYAPVSGRQKIYILDEAHMLSTAAWNAFLKTLEEPPPSTIFVLATTEAQKVPATVVDRCHRFDFQRPSVEQIATVVARSASSEGIEIGPEAVAVLARHASGSFRDALGTLEQLQTYAGGEIALADVLAVLGISDAELLFEAFDAIAAADPRRALAAAAGAVDSGHDPAAFIRELEIHARELLVVQMDGGEVPSELSLTPERDERLAAQAQGLDAAALVRTLDLLAAALTEDEVVAAPADTTANGEPNGTTPSEKQVVAAPADSSLSFERLVGVWPDVLDTVRAGNAMLGAVVDVARPVELAGDRLVLAFGEDDPFLRQKAEERATRNALAEAVRAVTGHALTFTYELRAGQGSPPPQALSEDQLVARLKDEFGAEELPGNEDEEDG
jgi:DNA polymerase III subunit gamma/tau